MTSVYVSYRDSAPGQAGLFAPGSLSVAQNQAATMPDGGEWAFVRFIPSSSATVQDTADLQDGAGNAVYLRVSPGSPWLLRGIAGNPVCSSLPRTGVPPTVAALWGISATCGQ